ncbi:OLC1v1032460C1 [Oldenlandia corymbosa var. corymbosa]|uniref:OLC1v1032460C1 n=1 Tax=Oldenlandia corymbosa var. corymbosa TaxID=529605 RepID=A0AAV1CLU4_OLDCO|nr:OLC1v1032460C1 [Oldenlandia corymbosa var. corymbosa]
MYVARPRSEYIKNPEALSLPPDGPNSGYLVIQDEESETYSCFGLCKNRSIQDFPFPQNKVLTVRYEQSNGQSSYVSLNDTILIPVLNLPLSSNRYYAIQPHGKHKGEAFTCSREEDMATCCFCRCVKDIKPKPFDPKNVYQQFEIYVHENCCAVKGYYYAKSIAPDGFPPYFLRRKGWRIWAKTPKKYKLDEAAPGLNASLRARRPDINFPASYRTSEAVVVGKWYSPFMFVKENTLTLKDQAERSPFYQVTLEQRWEQIFSSQNHYHEGKSVNVDVNLDRETVYVAGNKAEWDERNVVEGAIWFRRFGKAAGEEATAGLSVELVQRIKWEAERGGWEGGKERDFKVERTEKFEGKGDWNEFGCYVLVESFIIRRSDGSVIMNWDFRHTQHIKSIWN